MTKALFTLGSVFAARFMLVKRSADAFFLNKRCLVQAAAKRGCFLGVLEDFRSPSPARGFSVRAHHHVTFWLQAHRQWWQMKAQHFDVVLFFKVSGRLLIRTALRMRIALTPMRNTTNSPEHVTWVLM